MGNNESTYEPELEITVNPKYVVYAKLEGNDVIISLSTGEKQTYNFSTMLQASNYIAKLDKCIDDYNEDHYKRESIRIKNESDKVIDGLRLEIESLKDKLKTYNVHDINRSMNNFRSEFSELKTNTTHEFDTLRSSLKHEVHKLLKDINSKADEFRTEINSYTRKLETYDVHDVDQAINDFRFELTEFKEKIKTHTDYEIDKKSEDLRRKIDTSKEKIDEFVHKFHSYDVHSVERTIRDFKKELDKIKETQLPLGSWIDSARNYKMEGNRLTCELMDSRGSWNKTSRIVSSYERLSNNNGKLEPE